MSKNPLQTQMLAMEAKLLREALIAEDWVLLRAARRLEMRFSSLQRAIGRHPDLQKTLAAKGRGPGRPPGKKP